MSKPRTIKEQPPESAKAAYSEPLDWPKLVADLRAAPGEWVRLMHTYASDNATRSGAHHAAMRYGLEYRTSTERRDDDGRLALYLRFPEVTQ